MADTLIEAANERAHRLYDALIEDEDSRVCKDIPDSACRYVPFNFFALILANSLTKLGDQLANPKTVLAWLLAFVQAPGSLTGLLVPIRESGSMLPQFIIAAYVRQMPMRKWVWVLGSLLQGLSIVGIGLAALTLSGAAAGWTVIGFLTAFSLSRGLCSIAYKDVVGKTVPKTRRGRLGGLAAGISGGASLLAGLYLVGGPPDGSVLFFALAICGAGLLWVVAAAVFSALREEAGATEGGGNAISQAIGSLSLLNTDREFRRFVLVRALLLCSSLSAPFYVALATERAGADAATLGSFILASGLAATLSAPVWGRLADLSSRDVMIAGGGLAALLGLALIGFVQLLPDLAATPLPYAIAYFLLGIAHSGVRLGRKTYIVDMAGGTKRTDYVAVSNSVIGAILLASGLAGALLALISAEAVILVLSLAGLGGAVLGRRLEQVT